MSVKARGTYREIKVEDKFGQHARAGATVTQCRDPTRGNRVGASEGTDRELIKLDSKRLDSALLAARRRNESHAANVRDAYAASHNIHDVADSIGYSLLGFIAATLCCVIEAADAAASSARPSRT